MRTLMLTMGAAAWLLAAGPAAGDEGEDDAGRLRLTIELDLARPAALKPSQVHLSLFPAGRHCAFVYKGATDPGTVRFLADLGFKTTVPLRPGTDPATVKALEDAGAEIGLTDPWGTKRCYHGPLSRLSVQQAYDAVTTSRLALQRKLAGRLLYTTGPSGGGGFNRNTDLRAGYGAVYADSHFLMSDYPRHGKAYAIYLGRSGDRKRRLFCRERHENYSSAPNEKIYFQILANQFRGTLEEVAPGSIVRYTIRDFGEKDLRSLKRYLGRYGRHPLIWNATDGQIGAYEYLRKKARILAVRAVGDARAEVVVGVAEDVFPPFLISPLSLKLPADFPVTAARLGGLDGVVTARETAVHVDVPVGAALRAGCRMTLKTAAPTMTIPDEMPVALTVRNTSAKAWKGARLSWVGSPGLPTGPKGVCGEGLTVTGGTGPFDLPAGEARTVEAIARTARGARWGVAGVRAVVRADLGGDDRTFAEGFEIIVAPRLRVRIAPASVVAMKKGDTQPFRVHVANGRTGKGWRKGQELFIHHAAGPCKGRLVWDLPDGMEADPAEAAFDLPADGEATLMVKIHNRRWSARPFRPLSAFGKDRNRWLAQLERVRPLARFDGEDEPVETVCPGTAILRDEARLRYEPLDKQGLLAHASWDDAEGNKRGTFDRCTGSKGVCIFPGHYPSYSPNGIKGWCLEAGRSCQLVSTHNNIEAREGTLLFWLRRDPKVKNELRVRADAETIRREGGSYAAGTALNFGERIFDAAAPQRTDEARCGLSLRRYPGWRGKDGYLHAVYDGLGGRRADVLVPYDAKRLYDWRHVALVWSARDRRLEIYLDGGLAGKADPGEDPEWYPAPWHNGGVGAARMNLITTDHGTWCGTCRDELYIYNRALTAEEIRANRARALK